MKESKLQEAHKHSFNNKNEISNSKVCGCFNCGKIFNPNEIKDWIIDYNENTAQCPYCNIDSIIGDASGFNIDKQFLDEMHNKWFGNENVNETKEDEEPLILMHKRFDGKYVCVPANKAKEYLENEEKQKNNKLTRKDEREIKKFQQALLKRMNINQKPDNKK